MIVKIWPIKGDQGTRNCQLYIMDDEKIVRVEKDDKGRLKSRRVIDPMEEAGVDADTFFIEQEEDIERVIEYMADQDKTRTKYISGYLCDPETAAYDFRYARLMALAAKDAEEMCGQDETMSFHLVQSFPEELDISDEEVHACGVELLQKIDKHQGIVCSHVNPVVDDEGLLHGKCKHNHILLNAYIHPSKLDPLHPKRVKYNNCIETYKQLQIWNDTIAIEHGLPIILDPEPERVYSWKENAESKVGQSWKQRVRLDIEAARQATSNWAQFTAYMENEGYHIRDGVNTTYLAPDGDKRVRGNKLGMPYTKEGLEMYWALRTRAEHALLQSVQENQAPPLLKLAMEHDGPLTVDVVLGQASNEKQRAFYPLPLVKAKRNRQVLSTYFHERELYDVKDANGKVVAAATGAEVVAYLEMLRLGQDEHYRKQTQDTERTEEQHKQWEEYLRQEQKAAEKRRQERYIHGQRYYVSRYKNSRTGRPYQTALYDENGRRRTSLELVFLIAMVTLRSEDGLWEGKNPPPEKRNDPNFGPTDWKIQSMLDAMYVAEEFGLENPSDIAEKLNEVGAAYSRAHAAVNRSTKALENMKGLAYGLREYQETHEVVERIDALPDGPEKEQLIEQYADDIERYKQGKSIMNSFKVTSQKQIDDFWRRHDDITRNLPEMQERCENLAEEYKKVKKLNYRLNLAQTELYCFGPAYDPALVKNRGELGQQISQREFDEMTRSE